MRRRIRLADPATRLASTPVLTASADVVRAAPDLAGGDRSRLRVVPSPDPVDPVAVLATNDCRGSR